MRPTWPVPMTPTRIRSPSFMVSACTHDFFFSRRLEATRLLELRLDPPIRSVDSRFERDLGFPPQHPPQSGVVAVAAAHPLGCVRLMALADRLAGDPSDQVNQVIHRDEVVSAEIQWIGVLRMHDPVDPLDAVVHVHERPGLISVPPHLDLVSVTSDSELSTDGRRG